MDDHTYDHFMDALFLPKLLDRSRYDAWKNEGALNLYNRCNKEAKRILTEYEVDSKPDAVLKEIEQILKSS
jgi:trimethylamine--corrinoid protein Co-methyltransferase